MGATWQDRRIAKALCKVVMDPRKKLENVNVDHVDCRYTHMDRVFFAFVISKLQHGIHTIILILLGEILSSSNQVIHIVNDLHRIQDIDFEALLESLLVHDRIKATKLVVVVLSQSIMHVL
jgi:K+ transporter